MEYIINIGINNTSYSKVVKQINNARNYYFKDYYIKEVLGTYNNNLEQTIVLKFDTEAHFSSVIKLIKQWCETLQKDCIAVKMFDSDNKQFVALVYNEDFEGTTQSFNNDYFIN